ncbi:YafY family protein [Caenimonas sp. SL110]|uniref:helix-turn-helix transcriptional regulator n=1 Tax=Caenimonas sp. SL110 TaxID=1450524 RepID=UPI0006541363|nr:WYL domain-containing protein [Caenimonas sp. SL110]
MSEVVRLYQYKSLLGSKRATSVEDLMAALEISRATVKRDIAKLRDQLRVPIRFDRDQGGYVIEEGQGHTDSELPGLWFNDREILALTTIQQLLSQLAPGLLGSKLKPLQGRLSQLMEKHGLAAEDVAQRIRLVHAGKRRVTPQFFEAVAAATIGRKKLRVAHFNRQTGDTVEREVSPQRLVHYRDNWYLDAWCHLRDDLRSFSVDALTDAHVLETSAKEIAAKRLDEMLSVSYGIFGGAPSAWAVLKFTPERARWVRGEQWHPMQESREEPDGSYVLSVPYSDDREILGDILRYGADVAVMEPKELRKKVQQAGLALVARYV